MEKTLSCASKLWKKKKRNNKLKIDKEKIKVVCITSKRTNRETIIETLNIDSCPRSALTSKTVRNLGFYFACQHENHILKKYVKFVTTL